MHAGRSGVNLYEGPDLNIFILVCLDHLGSTDDVLLLQIFSGVVWQYRDLQQVVSDESSSLLLNSMKSDLFVCRNHSLTS